VSLKLTELIPELVDMLSKPSPMAPYRIRTKDGKVKTMVRQLVRINHHRNCMLCHAPSNVDGGPTPGMVPLGPVTSMQDPMPPTNSVVYYSGRQGVTLVRADITYLRQDFSVMQAVKDSGKWPAMQRFDFLVREREVAGAVALGRPEDSSHARTVLVTLQKLTGKIGSMNPDSWEQEVRTAPERPRASAK
jgi:hypothetical protein